MAELDRPSAGHPQGQLTQGYGRSWKWRSISKVITAWWMSGHGIIPARLLEELAEQWHGCPRCGP